MSVRRPQATGRTTHIDIIWEGRGIGDIAIRSATVMAQFRYGFNSTAVNLQMYSLAVAHASGPSGNGVILDGDLDLKTVSVPTQNTTPQLLSKVLLDPGNATDTLNPQNQTNVAAILSKYMDRAYRTDYAHSATWLNGPDDTFTLRMGVRIPQAQTLTYRRDRWQVIYIALVRVLVLYWVIWYFVSLFGRVLFHFRVFPTRVSSDIVPKLHQF